MTEMGRILSSAPTIAPPPNTIPGASISLSIFLIADCINPAPNTREERNAPDTEPIVAPSAVPAPGAINVPIVPPVYAPVFAPANTKAIFGINIPEVWLTQLLKDSQLLMSPSKTSIVLPLYSEACPCCTSALNCALASRLSNPKASENASIVLKKASCEVSTVRPKLSEKVICLAIFSEAIRFGLLFCPIVIRSISLSNRLSVTGALESRSLTC